MPFIFSKTMAEGPTINTLKKGFVKFIRMAIALILPFLFLMALASFIISKIREDVKLIHTAKGGPFKNIKLYAMTSSRVYSVDVSTDTGLNIKRSIRAKNMREKGRSEEMCISLAKNQRSTEPVNIINRKTKTTFLLLFHITHLLPF